MENIEQKIRQKIEGILSQKCGAVKRKQIMAQLEGLSIISTIINLVGEFAKDKEELIKQLQEENRLQHSQLNMVSFKSDPFRDEQILTLNSQRLSLRKIAKEVQMTPSGVSKALQRLGVYSVDRLKESAEN